MATTTRQDVRQWQGKDVLDTQGDKIGTIDDVYFDEQTGQPEWALVNTGLFGMRQSFVPVAGVEPTGDHVRVQWDADKVKNAPKIDSDQELSRDEEQALAQYYGMQYSEQRSQTGLPVGQQGVSQGQAGGMTRSEEEVRVGKTRRPSELVRLRKYVVTENVQTTVPVSHEEVRVEREPITDADRAEAKGGRIGESVEEETLYEEKPVVQKEVVPKERVRLSKEQVTEEEPVSEQVRKERIDVERGKAGHQGGGQGGNR